MVERSLIFGTSSFFLACLVGWVIITLCLEHRSPFWAAAMLLFSIISLSVWNNFPVLAYLAQHPTELLIFSLLYLFVGVLWSLFKWWRFVLGKHALLKSTRASFAARYKDGEVTDPWSPQMETDFKRTYSAQTYDPPDPVYHKELLMIWITYWPWSFVWTLLDDYLSWVIQFCYKQTRELYSRIARSVYQKHS